MKPHRSLDQAEQARNKEERRAVTVYYMPTTMAAIEPLLSTVLI